MMAKINKNQSIADKDQIEWIQINLNEDIQLYRSMVILEGEGKEIQIDDAEVILRFFPYTGIDIHIKPPPTFDSLKFFNSNNMKLYLGDKQNEVPGFPTKVRVKFDTDSEILFTWAAKEKSIIYPKIIKNKLKILLFHLFNFKHIFGITRSMRKFDNKEHLIHQVELSWKDWIVEIRSLPSTKNTIDQLNENGGYGLTHIGFLSMKNGKLFNPNEADDFMTAFRYFISFSTQGSVLSLSHCYNERTDPNALLLLFI